MSAPGEIWKTTKYRKCASPDAKMEFGSFTQQDWGDFALLHVWALEKPKLRCAAAYIWPGLRTSTASYDVQFSPVATFPISVRIMSEGFDRCPLPNDSSFCF